jgi:hypothetical protein
MTMSDFLRAICFAFLLAPVNAGYATDLWIPITTATLVPHPTGIPGNAVLNQEVGPKVRSSDLWATQIDGLARDELGAVGEQLVHEFYPATEPTGTLNLLPKLDPTKSGPDRLVKLPDGTVRLHEIKTSRGGWPGRGVLWTEVKVDGVSVTVQQLDDKWIDAWAQRVRAAGEGALPEDLNAVAEVLKARDNGKLVRIFDEVHAKDFKVRSSFVRPLADGSLVFEDKMGPLRIERSLKRLALYRKKLADLRSTQRSTAAMMSSDKALGSGVLSGQLPLVVARRSRQTGGLTWKAEAKAAGKSGWLSKQAAKETKRAMAVSSTRGGKQLLSSVELSASRKASSHILSKAARWAGPLALATTAAIEATEFASTWRGYRGGDISYNTFGRSVMKQASRLAGASYGWGFGSAAGAWAGAFGGPFIWITEPVGFYGGGLIGGVAGYLFGNRVASRGADYLFGEIDNDTKADFESEFLAMPFPG